MKNSLIISLIAATLLAVPAWSHHSGTMFDDAKEITVTGVVKEFQYTNPHSWLPIDVKGEDGKVTTWGFEAEGPSTLTRSGIHVSDFKVGTKVTMTGHPMKDGRPAATWIKCVRGDGQEFIPRPKN